MIARHIPFNTKQTSHFGRLVKYLTNHQNKIERVGQVNLTNCISEITDWAVVEIQAIQAQNKRTTSDKTYHLMISFPQGEYPLADVLTAIETRLCDGLGYKDHQRISVVHHDTDHLHIHVAINKIHPVRLTMHEPYYSYRKLAELCVALEKQYNLQPDNHDFKQHQNQNQATNIAKKAGIESLIQWVQRTCLTPLHQVLQEHGLKIQPRGRGLVVIAVNGVVVKASSLHRDLSQQNLEKRLGGFEAASSVASYNSRQAYHKHPVDSDISNSSLYAVYLETRRQNIAQRTEVWIQAQQDKTHRLNTAQQKMRFTKAALALMPASIARTVLYKNNHQAWQAARQQIHQQYRAERQRGYQQHALMTWQDWLHKQAKYGNTQALKTLRRRQKASSLNSSLSGPSAVATHLLDLPVDSITKQGTIIYRTTIGTLRDNGQHLQLSSQATDQEIELALKLAQQRYGPLLTIKGSDAFKTQLLKVVVAQNIQVQFDDVVLEGQRQQQTLNNNRLRQAQAQPGARSHRR